MLTSCGKGLLPLLPVSNLFELLAGVSCAKINELIVSSSHRCQAVGPPLGSGGYYVRAIKIRVVVHRCRAAVGNGFEFDPKLHVMIRPIAPLVQPPETRVH